MKMIDNGKARCLGVNVFVERINDVDSAVCEKYAECKRYIPREKCNYGDLPSVMLCKSNEFKYFLS